MNIFGHLCQYLRLEKLGHPVHHLTIKLSITRFIALVHFIIRYVRQLENYAFMGVINKQFYIRYHTLRKSQSNQC